MPEVANKKYQCLINQSCGAHEKRYPLVDILWPVILHSYSECVQILLPFIPAGRAVKPFILKRETKETNCHLVIPCIVIIMIK